MLMLVLALLAAPVERPFNATSKGTAGVSFTLPQSQTPTVGVTYFLADGTAARVDVGLNANFTPAAPATFLIGLALRYYALHRDRVGVFLTPAYTLMSNSFGGVAVVSMIFSGGAGVEYYFTDHFSAGGVLALGLGIGNLGGAGSTSVGLSTSNTGLFANIYF